jgi:hypothetical protein
MADIGNIINKLQAAVTGLVGESSFVSDATYDETITDLENVVDAANDNTNALLTQQGNIERIVDEEKERIDNNIQTVETSMFSKKRMVELNESNRLKTEQYNKILLVFVISTVIIIIIAVGATYLPIIPEIITQILIGLVGSFALIQIFLLYVEMKQRSTLDYSKLKLDPPPSSTGAEVDAAQQKAKQAGDLLGSITGDGCTGPECCASNVIWDTSLMKCVENNVSTNSQILSAVESSVLQSASVTGVTLASLTTELNSRTATHTSAQTALNSAQTALNSAQTALTSAQTELSNSYASDETAAATAVTAAAAAATSAQNDVNAAKNDTSTKLVDKLYALAVIKALAHTSSPSDPTKKHEFDEAITALMTAKSALTEAFTGLSNDIGETNKYSKF